MWKMVWVMAALVGVLLINRQLPFFPLFYDKAQAKDKERVVAEKKIDLDQDGRTEIIKKISTKTGITVRISEEIETTPSKPLAEYTFELGEESYVYLKTNFSNLNFADVNYDGQLEILVSVFDKKSQKSELNILSWNKKEGTLDPISKIGEGY
jgi:hypothetical protein